MDANSICWWDGCNRRIKGWDSRARREREDSLPDERCGRWRPIFSCKKARSRARQLDFNALYPEAFAGAGARGAYYFARTDWNWRDALQRAGDCAGHAALWM